MPLWHVKYASQPLSAYATLSRSSKTSELASAHFQQSGFLSSCLTYHPVSNGMRTDWQSEANKVPMQQNYPLESDLEGL